MQKSSNFNSHRRYLESPSNEAADMFRCLPDGKSRRALESAPALPYSFWGYDPLIGSLNLASIGLVVHSRIVELKIVIL